MNPVSKFIFKIDSSGVMRKHQKKHVFIKRKGPHIGLYVKIKKNKYKWVCWVNKFEQYLLKGLGVSFVNQAYV